MTGWGLPKSAVIGGKQYPTNTDFRDILEIIGVLNDPDMPEILRWKIAIGLFFDGEIPLSIQQEAMEYLADFISYGERSDKPSPKLIDWEQDAQIIVSDINKVAGTEVRALPYLHWWTFLSYFYAIGEGQLSSIVSIRSKMRKGKKLEKWEREFYREHKGKIDFRQKETAKDREIKDYFNRWL